MTSKYTPSQQKIITLLKDIQRSLSAQDIYVELRSRSQTTGLATIYRALEGLKQKGAIQSRTLTNGEAVYTSIEQDRHHLTCLKCGQSIMLPECPVHDLEIALQQSYEFKIFYHTLEFFGLCEQCQLLPTSEL
ncbi:MAG: transcriptional repressor [Roseofilum sp. SID3]|uniref:Fur family transcriptional regulator n=1 Tax=unclassified Roseofilum TaxID=2620099 RepID=UPI001B07A1BA|nr:MULTISPECIES: Fur family transcriptional regulator [unclassified Roseofilum]MBP0014330.1 transcriptional repressor [Roseofilum sp. SID3]MBP0037743.1 transcriptional repressor [Roseofilum sp. SID1]